jgi:hypothetical protein
VPRCPGARTAGSTRAVGSGLEPRVPMGASCTYGATSTRASCGPQHKQKRVNYGQMHDQRLEGLRKGTHHFVKAESTARNLGEGAKC